MEHAKVKQEPPIEFVLILPRATNDKPAPYPQPQTEDVVKPKRGRPKKLASSTKVFRCEECLYEAKGQGHLTQHMGTHNKSFCCETCQKKFARNNKLKLHQMQHKHGIYATAPEKTFKCNKCNKSFSSPYYLKLHQRQVHDDREVECEVCHKICKNRILLLHHSKTHVKIECSICLKMVVKSSMTVHLRIHSAGNLFECDLCAYKSDRKEYLETHINIEHRNKALKRSFGCSNVLAKIQSEPQKCHTGSQQVVELPTNSLVQPRLLSEPHGSSISEPVTQLQLSKSLFMQSFLEQVDDIPQQLKLKFKHKLTKFFGDFLDQHVD